MNLNKAFSMYMFTAMLNSAIPFLLLPILTKYISPSSYGILSIYQMLISFTFSFVFLSITTTMVIDFHKLKNSDLKELISSVLILPLLSFFLISLCFYILHPYIIKYFNISLFWFMFIPIIALLQSVPQLLLTFFQISENPVNYGKYQISLTLLNFLLSIYFVVLYALDWEGRILAIIIVYLIYTIFGLYILKRKNLLTFKFNKTYFNHALKIGIPLIFHSISGALFIMSDRLFIMYYYGEYEVGLYSVGMQIGMIVFVIQFAFNQAWVPYLFKKLSNANYLTKTQLVKLSYIIFLIFFSLAFVVDFIGTYIFKYIIDEKYSESLKYVFWIALAYSFTGMYKVVTNYIFYMKKVKLLAILSFLSLVLNLILNFIFINFYGTIGVAYATALTLAFFFIITFIISNKVYPMPWLYLFKNLKQQKE